MSDEIDDDTNGPWFPDRKLAWRLDVVTLLAVIGESSMTEHSQAITASAFCMLPRILPAPQAFLKAARPQRMPETKAIVTGIESGVALESISFFASILVPMELNPYAFEVLEIEHSERARASARSAPTNSTAGSGSPTLFGRIRRLLSGRNEPAVEANDVELAAPKGPEVTSAESPSNTTVDEEGLTAVTGLKRQHTMKEKVANTLVSGGRNRRPAIPAQLGSPLHMLTLLSFLNSLAILACAIYWHDGTAILSISLISLASSIVGYASWWQPRLMSVEGSENRKLPAGDVIIRTREGAFIYIRCNEAVARELFSGTEECKYHVKNHNPFMAAGTVILMLAVVLLGNCKWNSQVFIGASYIILNGLYWGLGMLERGRFWDLSRYKLSKVTPDDAKRADKRTKAPPHPNKRDDVTPLPSLGTRMSTKISRISTMARPKQAASPSAAELHQPVDPDSRACFTRTLWYAIREIKSVDWVTRNRAAPNTPVWKQWLAEAEAEARAGNRTWGAVKRKDELHNLAEAAKEKAANEEAAKKVAA